MTKQELKNEYEDWKKETEDLSEFDADIKLQDLTAKAEENDLGDYLDELVMQDLL